MPERADLSAARKTGAVKEKKSPSAGGRGRVKEDEWYHSSVEGEVVLEAYRSLPGIVNPRFRVF
jgi:hypothetical protein